MRKFAYIIAALILAVSCHGTIDTNDSLSVPEGVLRIFADKTEILSDGSEQVTFTVKFGSKDVSRDPDMSITRIAGNAEQTLKPGVNTFSTTAPAEYRFKARYYSSGAHYSDNEVVVVAKSVSQSVGQKNYFRKLWGMQFTAVSCTYCPRLSASLKNVMSANPGRIVLSAFHVKFNENAMPDPMRLEMNEDFRGILKHDEGLPLFAFNMVKNQTAIVDEQAKVEEALAGYSSSASCGVALSTSYDSASRSLSVTGKVTSNVAEPLRYHVILVEDGLEYTQAGADGLYVHDNVVRSILATNKWGDALNSSVALEEGVEVTVTRTMTVDSNWNAENMRVIFAVLSQKENTYVCANVNECALGASVDYIYNK
jgi:hypothetical protein